MSAAARAADIGLGAIAGVVVGLLLGVWATLAHVSSAGQRTSTEATKVTIVVLVPERAAPPPAPPAEVYEVYEEDDRWWRGPAFEASP